MLQGVLTHPFLTFSKLQPSVQLPGIRAPMAEKFRASKLQIFFFLTFSMSFQSVTVLSFALLVKKGSV